MMEGAVERAAIQAHIPLKPVWHQVMLSIAMGDSHGYAIRKSVEARTAGKLRLWPTTLYGTLRQIEEAGLIRPESEAREEDGRGKRAFGLTPAGAAVLQAETERLARLVELARTTAAPARQGSGS